MTNEEYAKENRELRRIIQRLKEQLTKALEELVKRRNADSQQKV